MKNTDIAGKIMELARQRGPEKSFCPSDVARNLFPENWRDHMEEVRQQAQQLADEGKVRITQSGEEVRVEEAKGPIRIQLDK